MLETELVPWVLLAAQLSFILITPLLSESVPGYEPRDRG